MKLIEQATITILILLLLVLGICQAFGIKTPKYDFNQGKVVWTTSSLIQHGSCQ